MSEAGDNSRPTIASVDGRVARLEQQQIEQAGEMALIKQEQQHIREIMDRRFEGIESLLAKQGSKLDTFMGKMEALVQRGMEQGADLKASPLGRLVDERLSKVEAWEDVSRSFHSEVRGMTGTLRIIFGTSVAGFIVAVFAVLKALGIL